MENILYNIASEAGSKFANVRYSANTARDNLVSKNEQPSDASLLRQQCLSAIVAALNTKHTKLSQLAVDALQNMVRDDRFQPDDETNTPTQTRSMQVIDAISPLTSWLPQHQCRIITILIEMVCNEKGRVSLPSVQESLQFLIKTYAECEEPSVRLTARAAIPQIITTFCSTDQLTKKDENQDVIAVFMDTTLLLNFVVKKIGSLNNVGDETLILLDAVYSIISSQPLSIHQHQPFINTLWRELCPCLIKFFGVPGKVASTDEKSGEPIGRGRMGILQSSHSIFDAPEVVHALYQIPEHILRILAPLSGMRSVIEAVFHKVFLYPKVDQRLEALRALRKILSDHRRLIDILTLCAEGKTLTLWKIVLDCLVECARSSNMDICYEAVRGIHSFLRSIRHLSSIGSSPIPFSKRHFELIRSTLSDDGASLIEPFPYEISESLKHCCDENDGIQLSDTVELNLSHTNVIDKSDSEGVDVLEQPIDSDDNEDEISKRLRQLSEKFDVTNNLKNNHCQSSEASEEEENASKCFIKELEDNLKEWVSLKSTIEVDDAIQNFATQFYSAFMREDVSKSESFTDDQTLIFNADAIYLTTYASLVVAYRKERRDEVDKAWFMGNVLQSGYVVYASSAWLLLVYAQLVEKDLLGIYRCRSSSALFRIIQDYDGIDRSRMSDVRKLQKSSNRLDDEIIAARRVCRWVVTASWLGILSAISHILLERHKYKRISRAKHVEAIDEALGAVHSLAYVAVNLGLEARSAWIFKQIVELSCPLEELREENVSERKRLDDRLSKWSLRRQDAFSMQVILETAIECGLASPECWRHVVRCTEYVSELENYLFGTTSEEQNNRWSFRKKKSGAKPPAANTVNVSSDQSVMDVLQGDNSEVIDSDRASRILCILLAKTDKFYENAGTDLNLFALCELLQSLICASESRLHYDLPQRNGLYVENTGTMLHRIALIIVKLSRRPLIHLMKIWRIAAPHFVQCVLMRKNEQIARVAIGCLHDCISHFMVSESRGFCFNQMLFQPFQDILCADMCSEESQDQIVSLFAAFVYDHADVIGSGWHPLFGALRALRTSPLNGKYSSFYPFISSSFVILTLPTYSSKLGTTPEEETIGIGMTSVQSTVLDVFDVYLKIKNADVLLATIFDYIQCVLHYLNAADTEEREKDNEVALKALGYLLQVEAKLRVLLKSGERPVPFLLRRLMLRETYVSGVERNTFYEGIVPPLSTVLIESCLFSSDSRPFLPADLDRELEINPEDLPWKGLPPSARSCVELYLSLMEGFVALILTCHSSLESQLLLATADVLSSLITSSLGIDFGAYCITTLVLPMLQQWTRRKSALNESSFKQALGLYTDLIVVYIQQSSVSAWVDRLLVDVFIVLSECAIHPSERIARLGCACIRHLTLSSANSFTPRRWTIVVHSLWNATSLTLSPLRMLMRNFMVGSTDPNGDTANVLLAASDAAVHAQGQIDLIAQQVFLLNEQRVIGKLIETPDETVETSQQLILFDNCSDTVIK
ncbi:hypothetical protein AB6A40_000090 [Gnathostoma spinigerum]|uniref:SEC7 domain-containing protein n=1 Tax=Gnathostoma spinigerum TaxID=75299 RepID=A0ABD6E3D3_9BILA